MNKIFFVTLFLSFLLVLIGKSKKNFIFKASELFNTNISFYRMTFTFVYNAKSGFINSTIDALHKYISPKTYTCSLCNLTHGILGKKKMWSDFLDLSNHQFDFYHIDDFELHFNERFNYPCILVNKNEKFELYMSDREIGKISGLNELIEYISLERD